MAAPRLVHEALLALSLGGVVWGALAFGAVYRWAYTPLAIACAFVGVAALLIERRGRPRLGAMTIGLAATLAAVCVQLVPLSPSALVRISPATDAFLSRFDLTYQFARATTAPSHPLSIAPDKTLTGALLFTAFAVFLLGMTRLVSVVGASRVCRWLVGFGAVLALVGIIQRGLTASDPNPLIYGFWRPRFQAQPFGPFVNPNHYAGWMLMALPIAVAVWLDMLLKALDSMPSRTGVRALADSKHLGALLSVGATCFLMALALLMTRSRSGLAAFAIGALVAGWVVLRRQGTVKARFAVAGAVLALLVGAMTWAGSDTLTSKFTEAQSQKSLDSRLYAWSDTLEIIREFPIAGSGLATYGRAMMVYQSRNRALHFQQAHNDYLQLAAEGGLLLGVPIVFTLGLFVREIRRRFREAPKMGTTYCLRVGAVVGLISIALQSLVEFSLQMPGNAALFVVLAAIALHQSPNLAARSPAAVRQ